MKLLFLLGSTLLGSLLLAAQPKYFIAIDADDAKPFSVAIGKKNYPSDPYGHLVIPSLKDTTQLLWVSFPGNRFPRQQFEVVLGKRDRGFSLKRMDDKNYVLLDWQGGTPIQNAVVLPQRVVEVQPAGQSPNAFAVLMAAVVNDPGFITEQPNSPSILPAVSAPSPPERSGSLSEQLKQGNKQIEKPLPISGAATKPGLSRQHPVDKGQGLVGPIGTSGQTISADSSQEVNGVATVVGTGGQKVGVSAKKENATEPGRLPDSTQKGFAKGVIRCRQTASAADIDKLRVQLMAMASVGLQLELIGKLLEQKCMVTSQVRALSELFFTDDSRYLFFALAYPYVVDPQLYRTLERFLSDQQTILRFRTMLK